MEQAIMTQKILAGVSVKDGHSEGGRLATAEENAARSRDAAPRALAKLTKFFIAAGVILGVAVVGFAALVAIQPSDFRITRSAKMNAPPAEVFAQVNDYHHWDAWSPWAKLDPDAKVTFEGPMAGAGAKFSWSGNDKVGAGRQTIVESKPDELIRINLEFQKPFQGTSTAEFTFKPEGDQTVVTWSMYGKNDFFGKAVSLFMDCDKMVGAEFEKGLASMKTIVETPPAENDAAKSNVELTSKPSSPEESSNSPPRAQRNAEASGP